MKIKIHTQTLPHFNDRPADTKIDTLVIHSIYVPGGKKNFAPAACIRLLDREKVSAHYLIDRRGGLFCLVPEEKRAWHAGVSCMPFPRDKRENVNHFSIGVELIGPQRGIFTRAQYKKLAVLISEIATRHPLRFIAGHEHIAPGRKTDPGPCFSWPSLKRELGSRARNFVFP